MPEKKKKKKNIAQQLKDTTKSVLGISISKNNDRSMIHDIAQHNAPADNNPFPVQPQQQTPYRSLRA